MLNRFLMLSLLVCMPLDVSADGYVEADRSLCVRLCAAVLDYGRRVPKVQPMFHRVAELLSKLDGVKVGESYQFRDVIDQFAKNYSGKIAEANGSSNDELSKAFGDLRRDFLAVYHYLKFMNSEEGVDLQISVDENEVGFLLQDVSDYFRSSVMCRAVKKFLRLKILLPAVGVFGLLWFLKRHTTYNSKADRFWKRLEFNPPKFAIKLWKLITERGSRGVDGGDSGDSGDSGDGAQKKAESGVDGSNADEQPLGEEDNKKSDGAGSKGGDKAKEGWFKKILSGLSFGRQ